MRYNIFCVLKNTKEIINHRAASASIYLKDENKIRVRSIHGVVFLFLLFFVPIGKITYANSITCNEVDEGISQVEREMALLKCHLGIKEVIQTTPLESNLLCQNNWVLSAVLLTKISLFQHKHGMVIVQPNTIEPYRELEPFYVWSQVQRILAEITVIKKWLDISETIDPVVVSTSAKRPIDIFNHLRQLSAEWDLLLGGGIIPNHVYGEAIQLNEEIGILLTHFGIVDNVAPPLRNHNATPQDSFEAAFVVLDEVQRLQTQSGIKLVDFSSFHKINNIVPNDVLTMIAIIRGEIQILKAYLGITRNATAGIISHYQNKRPTDVHQVLGYFANRLRLIRMLRILDR